MLIGVTQRVEIIPSYGERRDCLDQSWARLLFLQGHMIVPLSNVAQNPTEYLESLGLGAIIISGGNDLSSLPNASNVANERDTFEEALIDYCIKNEMPLLGVCRGAQIINHFFSGKLSPVDGHVASRHSIALNFTVDDKQSFEVNSFHNWGIAKNDLGIGLEAIATSKNEIVEAFKHDEYNIHGIMWHPEREQELNSLDKHFFDNLWS